MRTILRFSTAGAVTALAGLLALSLPMACSSRTSGSSGNGGSGSGGSGGSGTINCPFTDIGLKSGLIACPTGSNLCTIDEVFGSNGCYTMTIWESDASGNTSSVTTQGSWSTSDCSTLKVTQCGSTGSYTSTVQGPSDGRVTVDGTSYALGGQASPPSCAGPTAAFTGAPWSGTEEIVIICGDAGVGGGYSCPAGSDKCKIAMADVSGLSFQAAKEGISTTDKSTGCTFDFSVCGDQASLTAPVACKVSTDAGIVTLNVASGSLTSPDGGSLNGELKGTVSESSASCTSFLDFHLTR